MAWTGLLAADPLYASAESCPNQALRIGPSADLPDCRAYEQISPPEKGGVDAISLQPLFPSQASACTGAEQCSILYKSATAAFAGALGNELPNAYVASRGAAGWLTLALTPPLAGPPANTSPMLTYTPSADLSRAVIRVPLQRLTPGAPSGVYNLFLRHPDGSYSLVTAVTPPVPPTADCGPCFLTQDVPAFAGASGDFSYILFVANDALAEGAAGGGVDNLYETEMSTGRVRLVGILPDGAVPAGGSNAGAGIQPPNERAGDLQGDISQDGSRVLFEAKADGGAPDPAQEGKTELYDRIGGSHTVEVSTPASGAQPSDCETREGICDPGPAQFLAASADGSLVYFTSSAALTRESNTGSEERTPEEIEAEELEEEEGQNPGTDLYRYDVDTASLSDLTVDNNSEDPNGASVLGILGASRDGSYLYFVARGALAVGAESGQPNLYEWHGSSGEPGTITFIATLAEPSEREENHAERLIGGSASSLAYNSDLLDWTSHPTLSQAYLTPDGKHLAFMSVKPLTGYDNTDQLTGETDHEVFSYDAETNRLACASCDPSGAAPLGSAFIGARLTERTSTPFHQPRSLSDDGSRLFFSSPDPLVPGAAGSHIRVYEYEGGVIHPISSPTGASNDVFLDASANGDDVFFATRERLATGDEDELADVYDARVDGGLPPPAASSALCLGEACQDQPSPPPSWPSPASAVLAGNAHRTAALQRCRKLRASKKRARCLAAVRRRQRPRRGR